MSTTLAKAHPLEVLNRERGFFASRSSLSITGWSCKKNNSLLVFFSRLLYHSVCVLLSIVLAALMMAPQLPSAKPTRTSSLLPRTHGRVELLCVWMECAARERMLRSRGGCHC
ncbi:hypothetical protein TNCT_371141 [Trichonephila clavata]|uniref:Uncharacterized protein n=1 Tax=Trichonephila clavata TaxID=2740835 RepID=A0A8X6LYF3_TRICU|nr:hypothetical protein TNCT_371141 [Trichonephila clavata]